MKRSLVYQDGTSHKFWNISADGRSFTVTFGKVGTAGQTQTKKLASDAACAKEANALVAAKLKKGYVDAKGATAKKAAPAKKASAAAAAPKKAAAPMSKIASAEAKTLIRAIDLGLVPKVTTITKRGNVDVVVAQKYSGKTTPLLYAAGRMNDVIVGLLLAAGANVANRDEYQQTPLHKVRSAAVAKRLIDAGADLNARDQSKRTPLHSAAENAHPDVVALLLERGAEIDPKDKDGKTPYVSSSSLEVRAILKKHGSQGLLVSDGRPLKPKSRTVKADELDVDGGALAVDHDGTLWVAGNSAIFRWDGKKVTAFEFSETFSVAAVAPGPKGTLYFATNWGLVVRKDDAWRLYSTEDSELHDGHITDFAVDRKGRAYAMGYGNEEKLDRPISVFDGKAFTVLTAGNDFPKGMETNALGFDAKNRMLFGTETGVTFPDGTKWSSGTSGNLGAVNVLVTDGDDVLAATWRGVHRIDAKGKTVSFTKTPDGVKCIATDGKTLWIGMSYGGLLRVRGDETKRFKGEESGLDEDDVEGLALAPDGTLWIAAGNTLFQNQGDVIAKFDGKPLAAKAAPAPKPVAAATPKAEPKPKARKLAPLPAKPLVPKAKVAAHVVAAIEGAKLEGISAAALLNFVRPAIGFEIGKAATIAPGGSKLGGRPDLAPGTTWPMYADEDDRYLPLLFQIDLADVAMHDLEGLLPKKGRLCFFSDTSPDEIQDSRVLYDDGSKKPQRLDWPEDLVDRKDEDDFVAQLPEHALTFYPTWTLPSREFLASFANLTEADEKALAALETAIHAKDPKGSSTTRLLGWPNTLQGEIVSSSDTIVLLQIDADMKAPKKLEELYGYWGNGIAHFLIKRADLEAKKLDKAGAELAYT